jgi:hypothetical protein
MTLAQQLFIRWVTGPDENLPIIELTDEDMVEDEKGRYIKEQGRYWTPSHAQGT